MNNSDFALSLQTSAFDEYVAGRFLFLNGYYNQALILSSTAVEKYLKTALAVLNIKKKVHLDKFEELKNSSVTDYHILFGMLDEYFINILGEVYKYRYLDELEEPQTIGFLTNQFLGELDYTVELVDRLIFITDGGGKRIDSAYRRALKEKLPVLFDGNYLTDRIPKKEFMNRMSPGYALHLDPNIPGCIVTISGTNLQPVYEGKMNLVKVNSR